MRTGFQSFSSFMTRQLRLVRSERVDPTQAAMNPEIHRISLVPVASPVEFHTEDRAFTEPFMPTLGYLSMNDRRKWSAASQKMRCLRDSLGPKMTTALDGELKATGFWISSIESMKSAPSGLDTVDCKALPAPNAVLHVTFTGVGMASSGWSSDYAPRMNIQACLLAHPNASSWLTSNHIYYGADSSGDTDCSIPADRDHRFPDFSALIDRIDEMPQHFETAVQAIAKRVSQQCAQSLAPGFPSLPVSPSPYEFIRNRLHRH